MSNCLSSLTGSHAARNTLDTKVKQRDSLRSQKRHNMLLPTSAKSPPRSTPQARHEVFGRPSPPRIFNTSLTAGTRSSRSQKARAISLTPCSISTIIITSSLLTQSSAGHRFSLFPRSGTASRPHSSIHFLFRCRFPYVSQWLSTHFSVKCLSSLDFLDKVDWVRLLAACSRYAFRAP